MSDRNGYCPHGVYVGGIGIDWMCGRCEDGECPTCHGQRLVAVSGPDSFGMYETDDCPDCSGVRTKSANQKPFRGVW